MSGPAPTQQANQQGHHLDWLATRLTEKVAEKLGAEVTFSRWQHLPTGAGLPIFAVPADRLQEARALGLEVEAA